ncbi:hypothetical protein ASPCAL13243 [Aspergillus calidoustus]|uniref:Uncharacterized protein n=1 Tax=Aspergillus calidoustus TaxID=454130 RepID=A0A0U5GE44_ASPCI|nr:hypothetical protein ASPCAL13243 [Aspergillus calidoustus]
MASLPHSTNRSWEVLLSFPLEIIHMIFNYVLVDELYADKSIKTSLSCRVIPFSRIVRYTKGLRGACAFWADALRVLVFRGRSTRYGCLLEIKRLFTAKEAETFPMLRDCMVELCHPYNLHEIHALQLQLSNSTHSLDYVCAIKWDVDEPMDMMLGKTSGMGYDRQARPLINTFVDECLAAGLKVADTSGKRPNGGDHTDSEGLRSAGLGAMKQFFFKETLALWFYNAQIVRQILGAFPNLQYAVVPDFLHIPLLSKMKYFFPQSTDDDSPFAPISLSPPQMLQNIGITYKEGGRSYSDIMASMKVVWVSSMHYPAPLGLFPERFRRLHLDFGPFMIFNQWTTRRGERDFGDDVLRMLREQMAAALVDIPEKRKPTLFSIDDLQDALKDA